MNGGRRSPKLYLRSSVVERRSACAPYTCMRPLLLIILLLGIPGVLLAGCQTKDPVITRAWTGATQTMAQVVQEINGNNQRLPTLWARHYFEATIVDENRKGHFVNGDGAILYRSPQAAR